MVTLGNFESTDGRTDERTDGNCYKNTFKTYTYLYTNKNNLEIILIFILKSIFIETI